MSNSQGQRREIIRLPEIPRSSTPEPAPKRQRTSRSTSKNITNIPREARSRVGRATRTVETAEPAAEVMDASARSSDPLGYQAATPGRDPEEAAVEDARVMSSPARVNDTSEPEDRPLMATSWILPEVSTSTGVDTGAMPTTDLEQAAWDASVMHVSTGTDTDGNSMAVVSVPGDKSDGPTWTGEGAEGTIRTRTADSDGGATFEQESSSSRLISVGGSFDIVGGGPRTVTAPTRVVDSSERSSEPMDGTVAAASGVQAVDHLGRVRTLIVLGQGIPLRPPTTVRRPAVTIPAVTILHLVR